MNSNIQLIEEKVTANTNLARLAWSRLVFGKDNFPHRGRPDQKPYNSCMSLSRR
jgi:hypothetical protein